MKHYFRTAAAALVALALASLTLAPIAYFSPARSAVTYSSAVKTARMTAVRDTWGASAKIKIYHSDGTTLLATFTLSATVGDSTVSGSTLTCKFTGNAASQTVAAVASGTATSAKITTSADVDVITGLTVGTGLNDIVLNTATIVSGVNVSITACSFTHAALQRHLRFYA